MKKVLLALLIGVSFPAIAAPDGVIRNSVAVCDPNSPKNCVAPTSTGATSITETYANSTMIGGVAVASGTSSLICAARPGRKEVTIILEAATTAIRLRSTNDASATVGARLPSVDGTAVTISGGAAIYGAGITGATTVSVIEVY